MKKINYLILSYVLLICISSCSGYKPIFGSQNIEFKIIDYSIEGDKALGKNIYSKLYNSFKSNKNDPTIKSVSIFVKSSKDKKATSKNSAGKILEYRINLNSNIVVKNYLTNEEILTHNFTSFSSYKVQDQYSETINLENKATENLIDKTYQDLLMKLSESLL